MGYSKKIDEKWQAKWKSEELYKFDAESKKEKCYCLEMFSYPSAAKLHLGHWFNFAPSDSYARFKSMQGYNVLHPMGFDSFGLPAEQFAIKTGKHPDGFTQKNIEYFNIQNLNEILSQYVKPTTISFNSSLQENSDASKQFYIYYSSDSWTTASIDWSSLKQASDWGEDKDLEKSDIVKFSWQFKGNANESGTLEIDDIVCEGMTYSISTSLSTISQSSNFTLYPNPSKDGTCYIIVEEVTKIEIIDIMGEVIKEMKAIPMFDNEIRINKSGIYFIKAGNNVKKLIIK